MAKIISLSCCAALALLAGGAATAQNNYESWPVLADPFPSTGGGGIMIHDYDPVVSGVQCTTKFRAIEPNHQNFIPYVGRPAVGDRFAEIAGERRIGRK